MTTVLIANAVGQPRGDAARLSRRRRRLSTIVARHRPADRRFIVSVHRKGEPVQPCDRSVRLRATWKDTLVGPDDTVVITLVPAGKGMLSIGLAVASIALIALAPYAAPLLAGSMLGLGGAATGTLSFALQAGMVLGGVALGYAAQASKSTNSVKSREIYSLSGGGNLPKPGSRRPLIYGRCWSSPPLSQQDIVVYDGDTMVLTKRLTLGIGKFQIHRIRVGDATFWIDGSGIQAPFNASGGGEGRTTAIEFLYDQPSTLAPFDAAISPSVGGQQVPRPGGNPDRTPWFRVSPQGTTVDAVQFNWTYPAIYRVSSSGRQVGTSAGIVWFIREIDKATGNVIGPETEFARSVELPTTFVTQPLRRSGYWRLPDGTKAYEISAQNLYPAPLPGVEVVNQVSWDGMIGFEDDTRARPETTEVVIRIRAGAGITGTSFSDVQVEATRILPVWDGSSWSEQPTRKAVWAWCDLVRSTYGLAQPDGADADKALYYANLLTANDTYDGVLPEVSSFWEAASQVLHPMRADPVKVGAVHSFVRDESRGEPRHVLTRRQIVRDSSAASYRTKQEGGDVIVEFDRDGDPKRPDEVRYSYGPPTRTPKRYKVAGITDGVHALKHATWLAAVAVFRGAERTITTEWDGRLVYPGDHILSDLWFLQGKSVYGVAGRADNLLTLDVDADVPAAWGYGSIRTRTGQEWGILRMRGVGRRGLELHADDVAALAAQTGKSLSAVLARDSQGPTTVVLGELVELQETYVARSAVPSDADHVRIEMVADDVRVWQLLDEDVIVPFPVNSDGLVEPLVPEIAVVHARCLRIETGIEVVWGVSNTPGARQFEADLSYDGGASWEVLSQLGPASSGRAPMRQSDGPVTVRARAYGRTGLAGAYKTTTFTTMAPVIDGSQVNIINLPPLDYDDLNEVIQGRIEEAERLAKAAEEAVATIRDGVEEAVREADAAVAAANAAVAESRDYADGLLDIFTTGLETVQRQYGALAEGHAQATSTLTKNLDDTGRVVAEQRTELVSVKGEVAAAVTQIARTEASAAEAIASLQTAVLATFGLTNAAIVTETSARATADAASTRRIELAESSIGTNAASILTEAQTRATKDEALATTISEVKATADGNTAAIVATQKAYADADTALSQTISTLSGKVGDNATAITATNKAYADADTALAQTITTLSGKVGDNTAAITSTQKAYADADIALGQRIDTVSGKVGDVEALVGTEQTARADADTALGQRIDVVSGKVGDNAAAITATQKAYADADRALAESVAATYAKAGDVTALIGTEQTARANADSALGQRIDTAQARADDAVAGVTNEATARAQGDTANSNSITDLYSRSNIGTAFGRFSMTTQSAPNGVSVRIAAQASTDSFGYMRNAGWFLDLLPDGSSRFVIDANLFAITANGGVTYPFTFDGNTLVIPALRVGDGAFLRDALSQCRYAYSSGSYVEIGVYVRARSKVMIWGEFDGNPGQSKIPGTAGAMRIERDSTPLRDRGINYFQLRTNNGAEDRTTGTSAMVVDEDPHSGSGNAGWHVYKVYTLTGQTGVSIAILEIAA